MDSDEDFVQSLIRHPFDDARRLVYADWLEERGDPRGELLQVQMQLAQLSFGDQRYLSLWQRERELLPETDRIWLDRVQRFTTPKPMADVGRLVPELAGLAKPSIRLHPHRLAGPRAFDESKIGGAFLWPADEPWPQCPECGIPLAPVLQLRDYDVPEIAFCKGADLFQLFWCPRTEPHDYEVTPVVFWRRATDVRKPRHVFPAASDFGEHASYMVPVPCSVNPERIVVFPDRDDLYALPGVQQLFQRMNTIPLEQNDLAQHLADRPIEDGEAERRGLGAFYDYELSQCDGCCAGGGFDDQRFQHFLTLSSWEFHVGSFRRWMALEDMRTLVEPGSVLSWNDVTKDYDRFAELREPTGLELGRTQRLHLSVCRQTDPWTWNASICD